MRSGLKKLPKVGGVIPLPAWVRTGMFLYSPLSEEMGVSFFPSFLFPSISLSLSLSLSLFLGYTFWELVGASFRDTPKKNPRNKVTRRASFAVPRFFGSREPCDRRGRMAESGRKKATSGQPTHAFGKRG